MSQMDYSLSVERCDGCGVGGAYFSADKQTNSKKMI